MKHITIILAFLMTISSPVAAQDFAKGSAAYDSQDFATALKEWKPLAEQGNASAQGNVGLINLNGLGVPQNYKEAIRWFKLGAKQGNGFSQGHLAGLYLDGMGVLQNNLLAHMWYNISAVNGYDLGAHNRDAVASGMSHTGIEKAQAMAKKCMESDYTECGY